MALPVSHGYRGLIVDLDSGHTRYEVYDYEGDIMLAGFTESPEDAQQTILDQMALFVGASGVKSVTVFPSQGDA